MSVYMVDVESDGDVPGLYSMIEVGAIIVEPALDRTFYSNLRPLEGAGWKPEALKVTGHTREKTLTFRDPSVAMVDFGCWVMETNKDGRPLFVSDNNGFDFAFVNYYFHRFLNRNPFGHSSTNMGSLYKGLVKDFGKNFKHLRVTKHTHNPVDDARGNAEALLHMTQNMGLRMFGVR